MINKNYTKPGFEKAFKKAVHNFDETKLWFEHIGHHRGYDSEIRFVYNDKLHKFSMNRTSEDVELYKNYFIKFLDTGIFPFVKYYQPYHESIMLPEKKYSLKLEYNEKTKMIEIEDKSEDLMYKQIRDRHGDDVGIREMKYE